MTLKLKKFIIATLSACLAAVVSPIVILRAASFSISVSSSSVAPGGTFTVSISVNGAGQFSVSGSNATVSESSIWCDSSCSLTATAGSAGTASITVTAVDVTGYDESAITGSQGASVSVVSQTQSSSGTTNNGTTSGSSNTTTDSTTTTETVEKSSDSSLKSLSVSEGTLSPSFAKGTTSYKVSLSATASSIKISATANDSAATVSGTGTQDLKAGTNNFSIVVTAEDGSKTTYKLEVYVDETPLTTLTYNGVELDLPGNTDGATALSSAFSETTITVNDVEVPAWKSEALGITLLYLKNGDTGNYYMYDEETQQITSIYEPIAVLGQNIIRIDVPESLQTREGMTFGEVTVDEITFQGWTFNDSNFENYVLIYVMSEGGEYQYYLYEKTQNTLQLFMGNAAITQEDYDAYVTSTENRQKRDLIIICVLSGLSVVLAGLCVYGFLRKGGIRKKFAKVSKEERPLTKGEYMEVDGLNEMYGEEEEDS